jgi:hypothetical protein
VRFHSQIFTSNSIQTLSMCFKFESRQTGLSGAGNIGREFDGCTVKFVYETGALVKFDGNLKIKIDHASAPLCLTTK